MPSWSRRRGDPNGERSPRYLALEPLGEDNNLRGKLSRRCYPGPATLPPRNSVALSVK